MFMQKPAASSLAEPSSLVVQFPQPTLQLIYDTAPIGLAFLSPDCRYLQINQRLTDICGISVEDHLGRSVRDCVPALADSVEKIVKSIMDTGEPVIGVEVAGQRADQTEERFWITYWHPLRGPAGNIVGINVAAEEITERKRAEAALRTSEQETRLARDQAEAALRHLRATQDSLIEAEKLAALGRLVAGVAHEINSPVGTSLTVASSLERRSAAFADEAAAGSDLRRSSLNDYLDVVASAASQLTANLSRAAELIQSFKQVAVDRGYLDKRKFDLGVLTSQILLTMRPVLKKAGVTLNVDCQPGLAIESYPGPYGQVLESLLFNAVTHAFGDEQQASVSISAREAGKDHVEIKVADNGCGMNADVRRQAFDPFFTTRRNRGNVGLGLHIVHNIVCNRLGGRLGLDSAPGSGTTIRIVLPRTAPDQPDIASH
jgi:PAS domain S-box-containing protein